MTKRVREGSITLDDYDSQSLEVARQVETGLFMIRIHRLIHDDYEEVGEDEVQELVNRPGTTNGT